MIGPVLLVEDTSSLQAIYASVINRAGLDVTVASTAEEALTIMRQEPPNVVVLDLMLPDLDGLEVMRRGLAANPSARFIVITANGSIDRAVEAMRAGAFEFLVKPLDDRRFVSVLTEAASLAAAAAREEPPQETFPGFIGSSPAMHSVYAKIHSVSRSMATVFISGESGTGKALAARAIHDHSQRADRPFVTLNCAAIPPDMLESELFGHLEGAFAGAVRNRTGAAMRADRGTLFLDDVCELDINGQMKLLRFLQTFEVTPLGLDTPQAVNIRLICASNRDPVRQVRNGQFREELFYLLNVVPITLPPLRERGSDVLDIAAAELAVCNEQEGRAFEELSPEVADFFCRHPWPGNVRRLKNVLRHVVVLHEGKQVTMAMLPEDLKAELSSDERPKADRGQMPSHLVGRTLAEVEQWIVEETIRQEGGSLPRAAKVLDVAPSTLYRKRDLWDKSRRGRRN